MKALLFAATIFVAYAIGYSTGQYDLRTAPIPPGWTVKEVK